MRHRSSSLEGSSTLADLPTAPRGSVASLLQQQHLRNKSNFLGANRSRLNRGWRQSALRQGSAYAPSAGTFSISVLRSPWLKSRASGAKGTFRARTLRCRMRSCGSLITRGLKAIRLPSNGRAQSDCRDSRTSGGVDKFCGKKDSLANHDSPHETDRMDALCGIESSSDSHDYPQAMDKWIMIV